MAVVAIAWIYVVLMMTVAEATSPTGTLLGAFFTFVLYGALPLGIVMYLMGTRGRRARRAASDALAPDRSDQDPSDRKPAQPSSGPAPDRFDPDRSGHPSSDPLAAERKET
jgi:hypothetical protein